jgi:hypothetical protein
MTTSRRLLSIALLGSAMVVGGGCAPAVKVPPDAKLLFYGPGGSVSLTRPLGSGQVYLFDESKNKVVSVLTVGPEQPFNFGGLERGHKYRIYFRPDPSLTWAKPATQPATP